MKTSLGVVLIFWSLFVVAENNTFFGISPEGSLAKFKQKNATQIIECKDLGKFSSIRLNSEITWKYNHNEDEVSVTQTECSLKDDIHARFVKVGNEMNLWSISKTGIEQSVSKVVSELESKLGIKVRVESEMINDNSGIQYRFSSNFSDGVIRGSALEPYSLVKADELSMKSGSVDYVVIKVLKEIQQAESKKQSVGKNKTKTNLNTGMSGL